jgi:hypothetical protein
MKKALLVLVLVSVLTGNVFAQEMSAGGFFGVNFAANTEESKATSFGVDFGAFADVTYATASIGLDIKTPSYDGTAADDAITYLSFGMLGKYPIHIGSKFSIAPAVGFDWLVMMMQEGYTRSEYEDVIDLMNALGNTDWKITDYDYFVLKFGLVADFAITNALYARANLLGVFTLPHKDVDDGAFGADIQLAVGYKF